MTHSSSWDGLIEDAFLEQVRARPTATALVSGSCVLTYRQLYRRAAAVAAGLRRAGVRRETLVGLAFDRSADSITALLGIVLAGGAYVPIDPAYPARRVEQIVRTAELRTVVCPEPVRERFTAPAPVRLYGLDELQRPDGGTEGGTDGAADGAAELAVAGRGVCAGGSPLAYVMFTSGSTGRPKGVMVEHRGVLRLVKDTGYVDLSPEQRVLQAASLAFDAATLEIWGALLNGGSLHVVDHETAVVPQRFAQAIREQGVTLAWITAPLFHRIAQEDPAAFAPLRTLLTGGDVVSPGQVRQVRAANPALRVLNGYGPTENTTFTTVFPVEEEVEGPLPIGRPISGTTVRVCDEQGRAVPAGTVGELYTGGAGLARGYLGDPELTARKFTLVDGVRYYRTGDLVHADRDGLLHFHGRQDHQVKIRGHLVELAEVDAALRALPGVADAHTRVVGRPGEERSLAAYVVAPGADVALLRRALRDRLPQYLCPDRFVALDRLPLTASGKVDWRSLPAPDAEPPAAPGAAPGATPGAGLTADQARLAGLWADVLGVPAGQLGPDSDFFELGGNSLLLGVLVGRLGRQGAAVGYADAVAAPTLAGMARAAAAAGSAPVPALPRPAPGPVPLHPQQQGLFAIWQAEPESLAYNIPVRVELAGPVDPERLRAALTALVARHEALRMQFGVGAEGVHQQPAPPAAPEFAFLPAPDERAAAGFVRPFRPRRPDGAPLLRALLVRGGPDRHVLHLDAHHVVFDGVSLRILVEELLAGYAGEQLPEQPADYRAAAQWAAGRAGRGDDASDEAYWLRQLADCPTEPVLPVDRPRGAGRPERGAVATAVLGAGACADVRTAARRHRTTAFAVLFAAWAATLARISGRRDFTVGTPTGGRVHPDLEQVVGMFVNTAVLRVRLPDRAATLGDLVAQADRLAREALSHQGPPFPRLAQRLGIAPQPGRNPLFDVLFALQDIDFHTVRRGGLTARTELVNPGTTRFDLNLQAYLRRDELRLDLEYATDLYDDASARWLLDTCLETVTELLADPAAPVLATGRATTADAGDFELGDFELGDFDL
ncbi:non-ribosomal peptide synthetase [Streptacidiphilus albus]|uniref:non-ribosomal peptide synthetase n=1 Tax=Streptacidiphilus albus TaxID=105425 RepID=UPI00068B9BC6|nr:non-ribosomal peptide synthetase [Streptacidiphilus albus]